MHPRQTIALLAAVIAVIVIFLYPPYNIEGGLLGGTEYAYFRNPPADETSLDWWLLNWELSFIALSMCAALIVLEPKARLRQRITWLIGFLCELGIFMFFYPHFDGIGGPELTWYALNLLAFVTLGLVLGLGQGMQKEATNTISEISSRDANCGAIVMHAEPEQYEAPDASLVQLVDQFGSFLPWQREAARPVLLQRGPQVVGSLLTLFDQEKHKGEKHLRIFRRLVGVVFGLTMLAALLGLFTQIQTFRFFLSCLLYLAALIVISYQMRTTSMQKRAVRALALFDDLRAVGPLAEASGLDDNIFDIRKETRTTARAALTRLLPRLRSEDATLLNAQQRDCLYCALGAYTNSLAVLTGDVSFVLAILQALAQVGDRQALPYVRRLAEGMAWTPAGKQIREAAHACLSILQARVEPERAGQVLLRASGVLSTTPAEVLLRPAAGTLQADPQQLLRATTPTEPPTQE